MPEYDPKTRNWSFGNGDAETFESWGYLLLIGSLVAGVLAVAYGVISLILSAF